MVGKGVAAAAVGTSAATTATGAVAGAGQGITPPDFDSDTEFYAFAEEQFIIVFNYGAIVFINCDPSLRQGTLGT